MATMMGLLQPDCPPGPLRTILLRLLELQTGASMMNRDTNLLAEEMAVDRMLYHPQMAGTAWMKGRVTKLVAPRDGLTTTTMSRKEEEDDLHDGGVANAADEEVQRNAPSRSNAVPSFLLLLDAQDGHVPYYHRRRRVGMAAELVVVVVGDDDDVPSPQPLPYPLVLPRRIQDSLGFQC